MQKHLSLTAILSAVALLLSGCSVTGKQVVDPTVFSLAGIEVVENQDYQIEVIAINLKEKWKSSLQSGDKITHCKANKVYEPYSGGGHYRVHSVAQIEQLCKKGESVNILFRVAVGSDGFAYRSLLGPHD